jgi:drug/metabolite transporter (DMT)-like permease
VRKKNKEIDMSVPAAYIGVILIWSTTPLAIKWSGEGPGFLFGLTSRMVLGTVLCVALLKILRIAFPWDRPARHTYIAAGLPLYGGMLSVYWSAQYVSSGLVSVIFGLTPVVTGILAAWWLAERSLTLPKLSGMVAAFVGLAFVFKSGLHAGAGAGLGLSGLLLSVLLHSVSSIWIKRIGAAVPAVAVTAGALIIASTLYVFTWTVLDGAWPQRLPVKAISSIVYLGVFGSVIGFILYYYALKRLAASQMALITLVTPVSALLLGHGINGEAIGMDVAFGTALILVGLAVHQWGAAIAARMQSLLWRRSIRASTSRIAKPFVGVRGPGPRGQ